MILVSFMAQNKSQSERWRPIEADEAKRRATAGTIIFDDSQQTKRITAYVLGDGSVIEITEGDAMFARHYLCFDAWQIERFVKADIQRQIEDGTYIVEFSSQDDDGTAVVEVEGRFGVADDQIIHKEGGLVAELISIGPVTPMTMYRINHCFNNGYYRTRLVRGADE